MPGPGGCLVSGGAWSVGVPGLGGVCARGCLVPGGGDPPGTATAAGGTHPTGMHSCYFIEY